MLYMVLISTPPHPHPVSLDGHELILKCKSAHFLKILHTHILARSHTFEEIDHDITFTVILLASPESFKKGCCQLQAKVCAQSTG